MKLWFSRAEGLAAHLLWRFSYGRLSRRWVLRKKYEVVVPLEEEIRDDSLVHASVSSFESRLAELQREVAFPAEESRSVGQPRELSTGMFILLALLVLVLAIGSFFL